MIKDVFLQNIVQINCIPVLIIVFLFFFLKINYLYETELSKKFTPAVALLSALIIVDNFDYYAYDTGYIAGIFDLFHRAAAMLGYDLRLILMASLISVAAGRVFSRRRAAILTHLPALLNVFILLPCLFTDLFFYYTPDGSIGRGIFAYEPHILSGLYMLFLFCLACKSAVKGRRSETGILFLCGFMTILGFLAEFLFALRGILTGVVALDITFYYLYLHIEHFRFDPLTGVLNRDAFTADIEKHSKGEISHIMSIDLNNLKYLNDTFGHNEGDKAIRETAAALGDSLLSGCSVYRVGGDEFAVICLKKSGFEIALMTDKMYEAVVKAGYSCAIGYSGWAEGKSFKEVYKEADDRMYLNKRAMKEHLNNL